MIPYADFLYFGILLYLAIPSAVAGLVRRLRVAQLWILLATAIMLVVQYYAPEPLVPGLIPGTVMREVGIVAGYALAEWVVAAAFLVIRRRGKARGPYYAALVLGLAPLAAAKFLPLFATNYPFTFLGLSYITFRGLDVVIGIQDGLVQDLPFGQYLAFMLFFPTISSGPIDRYRRFAADWNRNRTRAEFLKDLDAALQRFFKGLLYKFILAALIKEYWLDPAAHAGDWLDLVSYMYAYSFYLFFDFAGYSSFAISLSYLLGIHTPENFNLAFFAANIREFWDRWHMSLSGWFRDHIYTRFVINATRGKWFKSKYTAPYLGSLLTMGLMGLWHGTAWYYLVYGLYHGLMLVGYDLFLRWNKKYRVWGEGRVWHAFSVLITFNLVCFGLLVFSGRLATPTILAASTDRAVNGGAIPTFTPTLTLTPTLTRTPRPSQTPSRTPTRQPSATATRSPATLPAAPRTTPAPGAGLPAAPAPGPTMAEVAHEK